MHGDTRSRAGVFVGLATAAGAIGVAAMISAATAPTARADDFTDVVNAIDSDYSAGQADFSSAYTDFSGGDVNDGLAAYFSGVDTDFVGAPDALEIGTAQLLANDPVDLFDPLTIMPEANFTSAVTDAQTLFGDAQTLSTDAGTALSGGDYVTALVDNDASSIYDLVALQLLIEGAVASL